MICQYCENISISWENIWKKNQDNTQFVLTEFFVVPGTMHNSINCFINSNQTYYTYSFIKNIHKGNNVYIVKSITNINIFGY